MELSIVAVGEHKRLIYTFTVDAVDLQSANISKEDYTLFDLCLNNETLISHKLFALATLAKKIEGS